MGSHHTHRMEPGWCRPEAAGTGLSMGGRQKGWRAQAHLREGAGGKGQASAMNGDTVQQQTQRETSELTRGPREPGIRKCIVSGVAGLVDLGTQRLAVACLMLMDGRSGTSCVHLA